MGKVINIKKRSHRKLGELMSERMGVPPLTQRQMAAVKAKYKVTDADKKLLMLARTMLAAIPEEFRTSESWNSVILALFAFCRVTTENRVRRETRRRK